MGAYFNPWRRKIGAMTLVLACMSAGAWVRSFLIQDRIYFRSLIKSDFIKDAFFPAANHRLAGLATERNSLDLLAFDNFTGTSIDVVSFAVIPFWSIVIPLSLLSTYLLLSTPRTKPDSKPARRISS